MRSTKLGPRSAPRRAFPRSVVVVIALYFLLDTFITDRSAPHVTAAFAAQAMRSDRILLSDSPAFHVRIDGEPVYRDVTGTSLARIVNSRYLILRDGAGKHFLRISDGWMTATSLDAAWTVADSVPSDCERIATDERIADLLIGGDRELPAEPSLRKGARPHIYIDTSSAEPREGPRA